MIYLLIRSSIRFLWEFLRDTVALVRAYERFGHVVERQEHRSLMRKNT